MKTLTLLFVRSLQIRAAQAQKNESFYLFDKDFNSIKNASDAAYFGRMIKESDTCFTWDLNNYAGPKIKRVQYRDEQQNVVHGKILFYNSAGYFDSTGIAFNNIRYGSWYYYNDTGKAVLRKDYLEGRLVSTEDLTQIKMPDSSESHDENESSFPGGIKKWQQYLLKNMTYPERAISARIMGMVVLQFVVDTKGNISDLDIAKSLEFSIDEEAARLIRKSPKWTPASQNGKLVKSFKKQPFYFRLQ